MNSIIEGDEMYLTTKEARESTKPNGCSTKKEMCEAFGINLKTLNLVLSGKIKKVRINRKSPLYEESESVSDLRDSIKSFIKVEISMGADKSSIQLAVKNITREAFDDLFDKDKPKNAV